MLRWIRGTEKTSAAQKVRTSLWLDIPRIRALNVTQMSKSGAAHSLGVISWQGDAR